MCLELKGKFITYKTSREVLEKEDDEKVKSRQAQKKKTFGSQDKRELGRKNTVVLSDLEAFMGSVDKSDSSSESDAESGSSSQSDAENDNDTLGKSDAEPSPRSTDGDKTVPKVYSRKDPQGGAAFLKNQLGKLFQLLHLK